MNGMHLRICAGVVSLGMIGAAGVSAFADNSSYPAYQTDNSAKSRSSSEENVYVRGFHPQVPASAAAGNISTSPLNNPIAGLPGPSQPVGTAIPGGVLVPNKVLASREMTSKQSGE